MIQWPPSTQSGHRIDHSAAAFCGLAGISYLQTMTEESPAPGRKCWAASLGGCDTMSREHILSQSIFAPGCDCPHVIEGSNRVPNGRRSQSSLTAKILCRKHNSALSPLDAEAGRLAEILLSSARGQEIGRPEIEGPLIERWALKTLINGLVSGWSDKRKWYPDERIVRAIYGMEVVPDGCGLYSIDGDTNDLTSRVDAQVAPYWGMPAGREKFLVGGQVRVHGLRLFVAFSHTAVRQIVGCDANPPRVFENHAIRFVYRPAFISVGPEGSAHSGIILRW